MRHLNPDKLAAAIDAHTDARLRDNRLGGGAIHVLQEGKTVYRRTFGVLRTGDKAPLADNFIFRTASMTKPVTAAAVLREADLGRIDLDRPLRDYLPEFAHVHYAKAENRRLTDLGEIQTPIRVYHLLSHTSGIGCLPANDEQVDNLMHGDLAAVTAYHSKSFLAFDPYTAQADSSDAFSVGARLVELSADMEYGDYLKKYFFDPLRMPDTGFSLTVEQKTRMISMHRRTADGLSENRDLPPDRLFEDLDPGMARGGFGLASTAGDYVKFAEMLRREGLALSGERILSADAVRRMRTPHVAENIMPGWARWGLGVRVICAPDYPRGLPMGAYGWSGAYGSHFWVDPVNQITAVYAKNDGSDGGSESATGIELELDVSAALE